MHTEWNVLGKIEIGWEWNRYREAIDEEIDFVVESVWIYARI